MAGTKSINDTAAVLADYNKYAKTDEQVTTLEETGGPGKASKAWFVTTQGHEDRLNNNVDLLGEIKQFALSLAGAITKADLQSKFWAICDGTTPVSQGIADPVVTVTPDLKEKFIRMSSNETSGTIGGTVDHKHTGTTLLPSLTEIVRTPNAAQQVAVASSGHSHDFTTSTEDNLPPFYELVYFIKVK